MVYYFVLAQHTFAMKHLLDSWGAMLMSSIQIVTYEAFLSGQQRVPEQGGSYIFNSLASLRRINPQARSAILNLHSRLINANGPRKVLNDPVKTLSRYELLTALYDRGINSFNANSLYQMPRRFPVFIRQGPGTELNAPPLRRNMAEYEATVRGVKWMRGSLSDMVAIEFCDTADSDGIYRKYGAFVVGDRIIPCHVFFSRNWWVKVNDLAEETMIEEELSFLDSNPHADLLRECCRLAHISYGRIDYGLLDGRPQIWEINLNPAVASSSEVIAGRRPAHIRFVKALAETFATLAA